MDNLFIGIKLTMFRMYKILWQRVRERICPLENLDIEWDLSSGVVIDQTI